jgi:hypothetical protein
LSTLLQDLRYASRTLRHSRGFTLVAVATIALGIGANTTVFSAISALLVRPLPFPNPDRLVSGFSLREGFDPFGSSLLEYEAYRQGAGSLDSIGIGTGPVDSRSLAFAVGATLLTGVAAGLLPALRSTRRRDLPSAIRTTRSRRFEANEVTR